MRRETSEDIVLEMHASIGSSLEQTRNELPLQHGHEGEIGEGT